MSTRTSAWAIAALAAAALCSAPAHAAPVPQPYGANDGGGFRSILPPGTNGRANAFDLVSFLTAGTRPEHNDDQRAMYNDLVFAVPGLKAADLPSYFKDATLGIKDGDAARTYSPRDDVTIQRDSRFGVPNIYGADRTGAMFGIGYVTAEDRLFFIDALRNLGRAQVSSFAGGAEGNRELDHDQWKVAPYTEADLEKQVDDGLRAYGDLGRLVKDDADAYIAGINQYIAEAKLDPSLMPSEYVAIGRPQGPEPFKVTDIIATASLVGGIFGKGGGGEIRSALTYTSFLERFGTRRGTARWRDFRSQEDPEAPTVVDAGKKFPYLRVPKKRKGVAIPDKGTYKDEPLVVGGPAARRRSPAPSLFGSRGGLGGLFPSNASNFLVVSGRESVSGHPLAVMGPQVSYFAPQILIEQRVYAPAAPGKPSIDAAGAAFPGVNLYVELGRGRDYAWSATSAGNDIIDSFALPLCDPAGGAAKLDSTGYEFRGKCEPFEVLERTNSWEPTLADDTPAGSETLRALRTKIGIVTGRATLRGKPVAYTSLRSTYKHEVDNAAAGFLALNTPEMIRGPRDFQRAAYNIGYTFNWVYADSKQIAYFNSGDNPVRHPNVDPRFPAEAKYEWRDYDPERNTMRLTPFGEHPQAIDQRYLSSWNGKQARGYRAADGNYAYGPIDRVQMLNKRIEAGIAGDKKMELVDLVAAMEDGGTVDLRGQEVMPWVQKVLKPERDPQLREALDMLAKWTASGAHRRDLNRDRAYDDAAAVALMDAWWPRLLEAQFMPALGPETFKELRASQQFHDDPHGHLGSAFDDGWYGFVQKDLRMLVNARRVKGRWSRTYCGGTRTRSGTRARCARALAASLREALPVAGDRNKLYSGSDCAAGDQICWDEVRFSAIGAITQEPMNWINRPTFQQVNEIQGAAPREPGSPFAYPPRGGNSTPP